MSTRSSAALYLAHAQEQLRGHERWILPDAGLVLGRELVAGDYQLQDPRMSRRHAAVEPTSDGMGYPRQVAKMFQSGDAMTATVAPTPAETLEPARGGAPIADELRAVLRQSGGNVAEAARQFGCSRQQIYRWMRAVGVELTEFRNPNI